RFWSRPDRRAAANEDALRSQDGLCENCRRVRRPCAFGGARGQGFRGGLDRRSLGILPCAALFLEGPYHLLPLGYIFVNDWFRKSNRQIEALRNVRREVCSETHYKRF